jgi:quercetin dioxygenase-like cupin family protein
MDIKQGGSQPSGKGQAECFTGTVRIAPLFDAPSPARVLGASVTFEPGATVTAAMTHIAIVEQLDGKSADWMEKVSDEQYLAALRAE